MAEDIQSNIRINVDTASAMDSIRLLQNQISAFHTQMAKMGAASAADSRNLQQNLVNSINSTGAFTANMTKVKTTSEQFTSSLEKNKLSMGEYFRYAGGASKTFGKLFKTEFETINKVARERVKDLQSQYIKLGRDASGAMQAIRVRPLSLDMQNLGTKTQIAAQKQQLLNQLLKQGSTNLLNFGKNTQWAGRQLMVGFTIPLSIMGAAAMRAYKDIEEAAVRLRRVYGDLGTTNMETDKMVKEIQLLAQEYTKYGVAVKDSMDMAATAAATGKKGAELLAQVASSARLAVLGGVDQQMALKTTISLTDAFGVSTKQLSKDINFLNAVENQTVLSIEDMTVAIPKAAPVIKQLGGDVKDLAFFLTAMKEGGINASESANALKSGLASLINPTNTASKMLEGFGINLNAIVQGNKGDVKKTVVDFAKALDTLDPLNRAKAIEQLFGKFQFARMSTLFKNVIEQGSQASEVLKLASTSSLELSMLAQRELGKIESSPLYKFQKSIADFQAQLAPVGEQFMKALTPIINFGADVLKNFNGLNEGVKGFIVKFVAVAGVVGPVLLMSFGLIANAVANVIKGFALMKDIFNKTGKSSLSLGEQVNYMTQEQIQAAAIASSLDQVHSKLKQTFTSEAAAVDMLTKAYERSVVAQRAFGVPITPRGPVARGPVRKYAAGGIISGPGTGTSDSILAMVSNGEAIIPAASVARNPGMVRQLVSGNIPGFSQGTEGVGGKGLPGKLILLPGGAELSHFSEPGTMPAKDLLETAKKQGATFREIDRIMVASGGNLEKTIKVFDNRVERISRELNQMIGDVGSGKTAPKELVSRDLVERGRDARSPLMEKMIRAGVSPEKAIAQVDRITSEIESNLSRMEKGALLRAEDVNKLTNNAYEKIASESPEVAAALNEQKQVSNFKDESGKRGLRGQREGFGINSYIKQRPRLGTFMDKLGLGTSYGATAFKTTREMEEVSGMSGREIAKTFKTLTPQQKLKVHAELKNDATAFVKALMDEAGTAVVQGVKDSTKQASPSREAHKAGENIGKGAIQGIQSQIDDAKNAGTQVGTAAAQGVSQSGRVAVRGSRRVSQGEMAPHSVTGQLVPLSMVNSPLYGPEEKPSIQTQTSTTSATKQKASGLFGNLGNRVSTSISGMSQGKFQGRMLGASMIAGLGSMVGGPVGKVFGALSTPLMLGGMFPQMQGALAKIVGGLVRFVPFIGTALTAWQLWDQVAVPLIRKNADAYEAIANTLNVTQEKLDGINSFFGTEGKITGIRAAVTGGLESQGSEKASIAAQFMESDNFKNNFQESAQNLKDLSDKEVKIAMTALGRDLTGMGYEKEAVQAIVEAMLMEAKKTKVFIDFDSLTFGKNTVDSLSKDMSTIFKTYKENSRFTGFFNAEEIAKTEASVSEISSLLSGLSGQFQNGIITGTEFSLNYDAIIKQFNALEKSQPGLGVQGMLDVLNKLNPEMAELANKITKVSSLSNITEAVSLGLNLPDQVYKNLEPTSSTSVQGEQNRLLDASIRLAKKYGNEQVNNQKKIKGLQSSTADLSKVEQKINDKYDKRINQLDKIKKLNDQLTKSQQGQLSLAEALNKGDIGAAARAATDIQNTDIQNALDQQKTGLDEAKNLELKGVAAQKDAIADSINSLQESIETLQTKIESIEIKVVLPEAALPNILVSGTNGAPPLVVNPNGTVTRSTMTGLIPDVDARQPWNKPPYLGTNPNYIGRKMSYFARRKLGAATPTINGIYPVIEKTQADLEKEFKAGGHITGPGSGTSDSIPAMLSNGEYVIRANAVKTIGVDTLNKLNQADRLGFAAGGMVNKFKKKPKPKPYTLDDLAKPITRADDPRWYDYSHNFLEKSLFGYNLGDANKGWYKGRGPSRIKGQRSLVDFKDGTNEGEVAFTSVAGTIKYYKALIESRRLGVPYIDKIAQDNYWTGFIPGRKDLSARNNLIANKMYGNYNGLDKAEAKTLASAMSRLWGPDKVAEGFKTLGLSTNLLTKKSMFTDKAQEKAWNSYYSNPHVVNLHPTLSPNTPKYADGGMVRHFKGGGYNGYADGGYIPREGGLPSNENLPADTANFQDMHGWMVARPGAGINKHGDEIYGYTRNEKTGKYTFDSAADAYRYYRILLKNRRALVPHIEEKYQENRKSRWMLPEFADSYRASNLASNKTYGPFNGLTQVEARTFAKSISAVYGKKNLPKMWKQFNLDPKLLGKPIKLTPEQKRLYNAFAGEITPSLSDNAPRFSYYADGGYVGKADDTAMANRWIAMGKFFENNKPVPVKPVKPSKLNKFLSAISGGKKLIVSNQDKVDSAMGLKNKPSLFAQDFKTATPKAKQLKFQQMMGSNQIAAQTYKDTAKRNELYKKGGFQGFEAGFNSWAQDLMGMPVIGDTLKGIGAYLESDKVANFTLSSLALPMNIIGGGVNSVMNTISNVQKGKFGDAALSATGFPAMGDAFASTYGHMFDKNNQYKSQFEVAAQNVIDNKWFGTADPNQAALARIIGGSLNIAADPATYLGVGLATKAAGATSLASKAGSGIVSLGKKVKTNLGVLGAKNVLKAVASSTGADVSQVGKLTPRLAFNASDDALKGIIKDDFYGNMRTGTRSSTSDSLETRIAVEESMMGISPNAPANKTPAYGFLTTKEDVPSYYNSIMGGMGPRSAGQASIDEFNQLINPMSRYTSRYGDNTIKLKPNTLGEATVSIGDSLSIWDKANRLGQTIPGVDKLSSIFSTFSRMVKKTNSTQNLLETKVPGISSPTEFPYIEAHLPGGFTVKDIESIMLNPTGKFGPQATEKIAADLAERKAALESLFELKGIKGIKITENGGIKIGNETLEQFINSGGKINEYGMANYPLPTKAPKSIFSRTDVRLGDYSIPTYTINKKRFAFQGKDDMDITNTTMSTPAIKQNIKEFDMLSAQGVKVMDATPEGVLQAAIKLNPFTVRNRIMLNNIRKNKVGKKENNLFVNLLASIGIGKDGKMLLSENTDGFALTASALSGNKNAQNIVDLKVPNLFKIINEQFVLGRNKTKEFYKSFDGQYDSATTANPDKVGFIHQTKYGATRNKDGNVYLNPLGYHQKKTARSTIHGTQDEPVSSQPTHMQGDWSGEETTIISSLSKTMANNGMPLNMNPLDTYFSVKPGQKFAMPDPSILRGMSDYEEYVNLLIKRRLIEKGDTPTPIFVEDIVNKEILYARKTAYTEQERKEIIRLIEKTERYGAGYKPNRKLMETATKGFSDTSGASHAYTELEALQQLALLYGRKQQKLNPMEHSSYELFNLAKQLNIGIGTHSGTPESVRELAFRLTNSNKIVGQTNLNTLLYNVFRGFFKTEAKFHDPETLANGGLVRGYATGGFVFSSPEPIPTQYAMGGTVLKKFAEGGYSMGTDTVPAMLTPGEFVIKKSAVDRIGASTLEKINGYSQGGVVGDSTSTSVGDSVYNYSVNVNVATGSDENQIARTVMSQIRKVDNHRVRRSSI